MNLPSDAIWHNLLDFHINETHKASKKTWFILAGPAGWLKNVQWTWFAKKQKGREKMLIFRSRFFVCAVWACMQSWREEKDIMKTLPGEQIFQSKFNFTSKNPFCIQDGIKKRPLFYNTSFLKSYVTKLIFRWIR